MPNHLISETSPYLLQHAQNPVDWYPWGEEALTRARNENKPIFLSIGYAACHWCHVMAHESFEDPEIAEILNQNFINIKVDREERPDLDSIYMSAVVALTGQGGWPLSVFLTPDQSPFFGGTYYPVKSRFGIPGFKQIITTLARMWSERPAEIFDSAKTLTKRLIENSAWGTFTDQTIDPQYLQIATQTLLNRYDWEHGGWGLAPKFPSPLTINFLLQQSLRGADTLGVVKHALFAMNRGGIYDVVGGGFHRYSTDELWRVPHFEKMLYDNAQLALAYLHAYQVTGEISFRETCQETLDFVLRELRDPQGGFYSSLDADSEKEEGKYYLWSLEDLHKALPDQADFDLIAQVYQIRKEGNFNGRNILQRPNNEDEMAAALDIPVEKLRSDLKRCHQKLLKARQARVRPMTDDKVITFWNAITLRAFAEAARILERPDYLQTAQQNATFLLDNLYKHGRLNRSWRKGKAQHNGALEDYACLVLALLALYRSDQDLRWFSAAKYLGEEMVTCFEDPEGGFFDTRNDQEQLFIRPKDLQDNATPSGNALAAMALLQLSTYDERADWHALADPLLGTVQDAASRFPTSFSYWLQAIDFAYGPIQQIAILYPEGDESYRDLVRAIGSNYRPFAILATSSYPPSPDAPVLLFNRPLINERPTAYICKGFVCDLPSTTPEEVAQALENGLTRY
jgi:uncharacterized protein YyaL (SSP411 family)